MKKYLFVMLIAIMGISLFSVTSVKAQGYDNFNNLGQNLNRNYHMDNYFPRLSNYRNSRYLGINNTGMNRCENCVIRGTKTCPKISIVKETRCREVMVPQTEYVTVPFSARSCPNCKIEGTKTCPQIKMVPKTVCEEVNVPKTTYETVPYDSSGTYDTTAQFNAASTDTSATDTTAADASSTEDTTSTQ